MEQTAVEWLGSEINKISTEFPDQLFYDVALLFQQAKEMEKQRMIDLVQQLKDYTRESRNVLGFDEREASEFVDIFYQRNL